MNRVEKAKVAHGLMVGGAIAVGFATSVALAVGVWAVGTALLVGMAAASTPK